MTTVGKDIEKAASILRNGGLVSIPTETVYGLAANALDPEAVARIFEAKRRPTFDPLIIHIADTFSITDYARDIPLTAPLLMKEFWPGPLTLVLPKTEKVPDIVTSGLSTVALRMPAHKITQDLLKILNFPLAAPSANLFGKVSPTRPEHVIEQLSGKVDYVLDGGDSSVGLESTILGWKEEIPTIYRLGGITIEQIEEVIGPVEKQTHSSSNPVAPGMLTSHYAPGVRLIIGDPPDPLPGIGVLRFCEKLIDFPEDRQWLLSGEGDINEAAKNLFFMLRELDKLNLKEVYIELVPEEGLGMAINDRLRRASAENTQNN